jgi:glycosyltransferase involved in cell wall biosynthesis
MTPKYSFDSLTMRGQRIFGWGWFLSELGPAKRIDLTVRHEDGQVSVLRCQQAGTRPDLAEVFPDLPHAINGGFLVQGRMRSECEGSNAQLEVTLDGGQQISVPLHGFPFHQMPPSVAGQLRSKSAILGELLRQRRWGLLARRGAGFLHRQVEDWMRRRSGRAGLPVVDSNTVLVFDHAMGGGANRFRAEQVAALRAAGQPVLLVTPHLPTLSYDVAHLGADGERTVRYPDLGTCLASLPITAELVINSLVSYDDPGAVLDWSVATQASARRVTFYLHDFHAACPVWTLVDETGRHCGLPGPERCRRCLAKNDAPFLALMPEFDIQGWRERWYRFFGITSTVVAFSRSSIDLLRRAFPDLPVHLMRHQPHDTSYIRPDPVEFDLSLPLTVAIVGAINIYKGAAIVGQMAQLAEAEDWPVRMVVIGTVDGISPSAKLHVTGPYQSDELSAILRRELVGICLLPSVCPETFSYVTAELMAHQMPLAVFNIGAPAERVAAYPLGCIIDTVDGRSALETLMKFRDTLRGQASPAFGATRAGPQ